MTKLSSRCSKHKWLMAATRAAPNNSHSQRKTCSVYPECRPTTNWPTLTAPPLRYRTTRSTTVSWNGVDLGEFISVLAKGVCTFHISTITLQPLTYVSFKGNLIVILFTLTKINHFHTKYHLITLKIGRYNESKTCAQLHPYNPLIEMDRPKVESRTNSPTHTVQLFTMPIMLQA